ncbi:hypothetical protein DYU11_01605 [Fibrisoma montanum]|uniref:Uncharacterized protein n=2 Tax=Fibrisoma montanum TaxID=2305895 RepID=A0A418MHY3_9BACT|nr:hypothetical protein DYU11_01605 [Fibrisoma montanum]
MCYGGAKILFGYAGEHLGFKNKDGDHFYSYVNYLFPIFLAFAEYIVRTMIQQPSLSFWQPGIASAAMGLLLGNLKPKQAKLSEKIQKAMKKEHSQLLDVTYTQDGKIIRLSWVAIVVQLVIWCWVCTLNNTKAIEPFCSDLEDECISVVCYVFSVALVQKKETSV